MALCACTYGSQRTALGVGPHLPPCLRQVPFWNSSVSSPHLNLPFPCRSAGLQLLRQTLTWALENCTQDFTLTQQVTHWATSWIQLEYFHQQNQFSSFLMSHAMVPPSRESLEELKPSLVAWHSFSTGLELLMIKNFPELSYVNSPSVTTIVKAKPLLRRVPSQFSSDQIRSLGSASSVESDSVGWDVLSGFAQVQASLEQYTPVSNIRPRLVTEVHRKA